MVAGVPKIGCDVYVPTIKQHRFVGGLAKVIGIIFLSFILLVSTSPVYSQTSDSTDEISIEEQLNELLGSLSSLQKTLKKQRIKKPISRKVKLITRNIIRAVNSIPPDKCLKILTAAMDDFFELVSDLGSGIACGPPILPPFLPGGEEIVDEDLSINCIPPEFDEPIARLQIGGPYGGAFSDVHPAYNQCRDLFQTDSDASNIPDVCEGAQ